jgi:hypothetical protein
VSDLVELARRYVALSDQLEAVRGEIARAVLNGPGGEPVRPIQPARSAGGGQHPNAIAAAEAEREIVELLRATPGMGTTAIAKATGSKASTTIERLRRLKARGQVQGGGDDGWQAVA